MSDPAEIERRACDQIRWATVVRREGKTVVVRAGDLESGPVPWVAGRAGKTKRTSKPSVGEQGLLICAEGELKLGTFLPGVASTANPLPGADDDDVEVLEFEDGTQLTYDPASHLLRIVGAAGMKLQLVGDLEVTGKITATGDVVAGEISLRDHKTPGIQRGDQLSDPPQ